MRREPNEALEEKIQRAFAMPFRTSGSQSSLTAENRKEA